jgi:hypothetical protein
MMTRTRLLLALTLLGLAPLAGFAASTTAPAKAANAKAVAPPAGKTRKSRFPIGGMPESARVYYADLYGIDDMSAKLTESGQLVRFSYRVVDAAKAKLMMDRAAEPALQDEAAHVSLSIPVMDKVGPLRQSMGAVEGKSYWMAFSNKGGPVKAGHKVSVAIGPVRIDGLVIE